MNRSIFHMIKYINGPVFPKARYMNGVGVEYTRTTGTPSYPMFSSCPLYEKLSFIQQRKEVVYYYYLFIFLCILLFFDIIYNTWN